MATEDVAAPHGRNEDGSPIAPYGFKADGTPRKSNRGARPGMRGNRARKPAASRSMNKTDAQRKMMLLEMGNSLITTPLIGASSFPPVVERIGQRQADALAGDALIFDHFAPHLIDGVLIMAQSKPGMLAWLDKVEDATPYLHLTMVGIAMTKAIIGNHMNPDPRNAALARSKMMVQMEAAQQAAEQMAREAGIDVDAMMQPQAGQTDEEDSEPTVRIEPEPHNAYTGA